MDVIQAWVASTKVIQRNGEALFSEVVQGTFDLWRRRKEYGFS